MDTFFMAAGLAVALALLVGLHYRLGELPINVWAQVKRDRDTPTPKALDAMKEAVAIKAGAAVLAIQRHEENLAATFRAQVAEAETRARMSERRAADTVTALQAAAELVRELRGALDAAPRAVAPPPEAIETARKPGSPEPASRERSSPRTGLPPGIATSPDGEERLSEDEMTRVALRPDASALNLGKTLVSPSGTRGAT